ncbi:glutamate-1-semialdehyde 2,1-aminomutase [Mesorhizobium sp. LSJC268A00]|uniref:aspartate aminotransferase family protein n=1 Tax=unclassified Mesorhizobium TaxID=325217 RepID=UPI0003CF3727|nr:MULTISPECIES: aminotransferase class III-fold pyridoxal phosphate-dependent enzyme [unclassified Mesorhizobium]ESX06611.1 glutamate-1-semialdehyde 2,1-aminomutase [Mesorhizobium sp. LSJC268A00]ESZ36994.1 glutamate-1-semialdehyde 2,1-aminomutase [Mesorhizobium sp. L2C067A000]
MLQGTRDVRANVSLAAVLDEARQCFADANPNSLARQNEAAASLPGGNTRAVLWYPPFPVSFVSGEGCRVTDLDGHTYVDLVSEYSAGFYGHSDKAISAALVDVIQGGIMLGAPNRYEARLAAAVVERFPAIERVRFCNSGTEANIMAISAARAITKRSKILAFREGYHGGVLTFAHGGSPLNLPFPFVFADYNDSAGAVALIKEQGDDLAAVIVEPMMGGGGCIPATCEFLQALRTATKETGALLIFDEVMTSRLDYRALHGAHEIFPDFVTLGKYIGGGASFGAFGGRADLVDRFDPALPDAFSHGGTFNNNILSMAAGFTGLTQVLTREASRAINARGDRLREAMNVSLERHAVEGIVIGRGSLMNLHFVRGPVDTPARLDDADPSVIALWHIEMLLRGYYVTPRGMLALSLPFGDAELDGFAAAFDDFLSSNLKILPRRTN